MIKILFILVCSGLWRLGGWDKAKWSGYRDVLVPVLLAMWYAITLRWWMFLAVGLPANIIRMGYGAYDPEHDDKPSLLALWTKDRNGYYIRAIYGFITSSVIAAVPAIYTGHYLKYVIYIIGNTVLEFVLSYVKAKDVVHEPLAGAGRASIACLI